MEQVYVYKVTDVSELKLDGSMLMAVFRPPFGFSQPMGGTQYVGAAMLLAFTGNGAGDNARILDGAADSEAVAIPPGWKVVAS